MPEEEKKFIVTESFKAGLEQYLQQQPVVRLLAGIQQAEEYVAPKPTKATKKSEQKENPKEAEKA